MKKLRICLCILSVILFMGIVFKPGYRIIVNDHPLPGIYDVALATECSSAAIRAAEEITRHSEAPSYTMIPVLCLRHTQADPKHLWSILLESFEGVEKMYVVSMKEEVIGTVSNLREVYQIKNEYFPVWSPNATLSIRETYTYAGTETSTDALHAAFHRLAGTTLPV